MKLIRKEHILTTFKTYNDIKYYVFKDRIDKACHRFGCITPEKMDSFRSCDYLNCSCLNYLDFKKVLRFYYNYDLSKIADGIVVSFECCPNLIKTYFQLDQNSYLIKPCCSDIEYDNIETYVNNTPPKEPNNQGAYSLITQLACIMLYKGYQDSLDFFTRVVDNYSKEFESSTDYQQGYEKFIVDFKEAIQLYYIHLYHSKRLSNNHILQEKLAEQIFDRVRKHCENRKPF